MLSLFPKNYFQKQLPFQSWMGLSKIRLLQEVHSESLSFLHSVYHLVHLLPLGAKILDIGCGQGYILDQINKLRPDIELFGCDIGEVTDFLNGKINFSSIDLASSDLQFSYKDNTFDLIFSTQVLEHLLFPQNIFYEVKRVLVAGGIFYVDAPSNRTLWMPGALNFYMDPTHIRPYTENSLRILGNNSDMQILKIWHPRNYPINSLFLILLIPVLFPLSWFSESMKALNIQAWNVLLGLCIAATYKK